MVAERGLQPGDRLPTERQIAEELRVSRAVTREAFKMLSATGQVSIRKGAGIFVASGRDAVSADAIAGFQTFRLDQVSMLFDYRAVVEVASARRAASFATPPEIRALWDAAQHTADAAQTGDVTAFSAADPAFHIAVAHAAHNVFIESSVQRVHSYVRQVGEVALNGGMVGPIADAAKQHTTIAGKVADGEANSAAAAMLHHIEVTRLQFESVVKRRLLQAL